MIACVRPLFGDAGPNLCLKFIACNNGVLTYRNTEAGCQDDDRRGEGVPIDRDSVKLVGEKVSKLVSYLSSDTY